LADFCWSVDFDIIFWLFNGPFADLGDFNANLSLV